jgi:predicted GTPase
MHGIQAHNPNVIVFGETGTGKSSVINLILGTYKAPISNDAMGCTFSSACYKVQIQEKIYNLYDTAGFNESATGTVSSAKAIANLYTLVRTLSDTGGVNLLVFVVRCGRLTESTKKNYDLFRDTFCQSRVPVVVVVTACEEVDPMDTWWVENKEKFEGAGMMFHGHACVCAYRGRKNNQGLYLNDDLYIESRGKVVRLIHTRCLPTGWSKVSHAHDLV